MNPRLTISVCTYQSGDFDVMLIDEETKEEVCFSGNQKITDEQLDIVNRLAPACVWTTYYPSEQYKALQARCDKLEAAARDACEQLKSLAYASHKATGRPLSKRPRTKLLQRPEKVRDNLLAVRKALRSVVEGG